MATEATLPAVVAGLAVGIGFVVLFSLSMTPSSFPFSYDGRIIASTMELKEAQVFLSEYPSAKVEVDRTDEAEEEEVIAVKYSAVKIDYEEQSRGEMQMIVMIDKDTGKPDGEIRVSCSGSSLNSIGSRTAILIPGTDIATYIKESTCAK